MPPTSQNHAHLQNVSLSKHKQEVRERTHQKVPRPAHPPISTQSDSHARSQHARATSPASQTLKAVSSDPSPLSPDPHSAHPAHTPPIDTSTTHPRSASHAPSKHAAATSQDCATALHNPATRTGKPGTSAQAVTAPVP